MRDFLRALFGSRWQLDVFEGNDGLWYYHAKGANGEIAIPSEGYTRSADAVRAARRARWGLLFARIKVTGR